MNSAPKTNQICQLYQVPADINAPMMSEQRYDQNSINTTTNTTLEREVSYQSPRVMHPQLNIVQNQTEINQFEVSSMQKTLKSSGQFVVCPYCKRHNVTRTEERCSFLNVACCVVFGPIPWILLQALRKKEINCYNAEHFCIHCGSKLASYKAC
jgi:hypothetical protein